MKRLICITGIILIACVLTQTAFATPQGAGSGTADVEYVTESTTDEVYILKIVDGYLNVYKSGEDEPFLQTGTMSGNLPQSDVSVLTKGVEIRGKDALRKALEDYCS